MAFGRQMHDDVGLIFVEDSADARAVADIDALERITKVAGDRRKRGEISGIGQLVDDLHGMRGFAHEFARDG